MQLLVLSPDLGAVVAKREFSGSTAARTPLENRHVREITSEGFSGYWAWLRQLFPGQSISARGA